MQNRKTMSRIFLLLLSGVFILTIYFIATSILSNPGHKLAVHYIDVGYGNCTLIEFPNRKNMLVDTGEEKAGPIVIRYLKNKRIRKIDNVLITHNHPDHSGALKEILAQFQVDRIIKTSETVSGYGEVKVNIISARNSSDLNDSSLVVKISFASKSFLFPGDIGSAVCDELAKNLEVKSSVVVVPHHGKSSTLNFIKAVSPKVAVVSTGESQWGGPDENILKMYKEQGVKILRTDKAGTITIITDGQKLWY